MSMTDKRATTHPAAAGTEVAPIATAGVSPQDTEVFQRFLAAAEDASHEVDADEVTMNIVARVLNASTADDVLGQEEVIHARDVIGMPFALLDVHFNQSTIEGDGPGFYAILQAVNRDGEKLTISCGARQVIAQAWRLKDLDALPVDVQIDEAQKVTAAGYRPMWLAKAAKSF